MKEKPSQAAFNNLAATFRDMDHADFLAGVQASLGYVCDYVAWQDEAEDAIEPLEQMAWHGDERAFRSLLYLGTKIATILERHATLASGSSENDGDPFLKIIPNRQKGTSLGSSLTREDLEILASLPDEKRRGIDEPLESAFPDMQTPFLPECLLKISQNASAGLPVTFDNPENLTAPEFRNLESLTGKLASVRARLDCTRMVLEEMARAEVWPTALPTVRELRAAQLEQFEALRFGSSLRLTVNPPEGRGKALGFTREGATTFAYPIYVELERERSYPRSPGHLEDIRKSYAAYSSQSYEDGTDDESTKEESIKEEGTKEESVDCLIKYNIIPASQSQPWNELNEWKAEAALLQPLSNKGSIIDSWTATGMKLLESELGSFSEYKFLPESLRNKARGSDEDPSPERIKDVILTALKKGLKSIASRIDPADQGDEKVAR